jgi:predicted ATPase
MIIIPYIYLDTDTSRGSAIFEIALKAIQSFINELLVIYPLNIRSMKDPHRLKREIVIKDDGSNIASVFHSIYLKEGKVPDEIKIPLSMIFPDFVVRPELTEDGRVMIKIWEKDLELLPPNTSDGFYKALAILIASYLNPPLVLIDEIEDSLHPETLELILDTIRRSNSQAIITTHSPVVIDIVEPKDVILVEKEYSESKFKRIKDPEKIKEFLHEKGFTFSEGWLYGSLFKEE